jgi:hypothetical protein
MTEQPGAALKTDVLSAGPAATQHVASRCPVIACGYLPRPGLMVKIFM